jgi:erythromycin esterase-like protein
MREVAMADNLLWVEQRECRRGRILFFAHNEHVQAGLGILGSPRQPPPGQYRQIRGAGSYLRAAFGYDLFVIGTYFQHTAGFSAPEVPSPPDGHDMEDLLSSLSIPRFVMSLHELPASGPLHEWFATAHATRASIVRDALDTVTPREAYDAIFFINAITPSPPPQKP